MQEDDLDPILKKGSLNVGSHVQLTITIQMTFGLFVGVFLKENKKPVINQPAKFLIERC